MLFLTILLLCFFLSFSKKIIKLLNVSKVFASKHSDASPTLQKDLREARSELQRLINSGPGYEYSFVIKKMRAEQKIKDVEQKILGERKVGQMKSASAEIVLNYVVKAILYTSLATLSGLLTFPTGVPNAVSVPIWVLSCNITFRLISGLIK